MKIKTKLTLGVGLLFLLIVTLSAMSIWSVQRLKKDTAQILKANYNTLTYSRNMLKDLDNVTKDPRSLDNFKENLRKQLANLTEPGEMEASQSLSDHFSQLVKQPTDEKLPVLIREDVLQIMSLNMSAIAAKSESAINTSEDANIWIGTTGAVCFLIAFTLLINLPGNIGDPIAQLTASIREITAHNYRQRVHFEAHSEFGELATSFNTMAEKLEEYAGTNLSRLLMEKKRIETLINNMRDPVIGLDENQTVLFVNNEALGILGLQKQAILGKNIPELAERNDLLRTLIHGESPGDKRTAPPIRIYANGKESFFEKELIPIKIVPTGEKDEQLIGAVIMLKNITPFRELDLAKTNFIATVSHELKTPIASIKMGLQLLQNNATGNLNTEQQQLLQSIGDDSDRLLQITGELLNMSQVETGNIQMNIRQSKVSEIVNYAINATHTAAENRQLLIKTEIPENPSMVKADPEKAAWVLTNFLSNAIRYSPEQGEIIVRVSEENNQVKISVQDHGRGIDTRYQQRIFERYFQMPGSNRSGTGLGLAISKEFIETQGGEIGVESTVGLGSNFFFYLPVV
ncbi:ATP-binding protein [Olivibacter sp. CPCC 100613]|uniref:HAMP domain-containing sensor histidine kinase n=1 Tax=Olivibacter sp. CPCC 100613 TaxID=3079931 RepID=UPI002FFAA7C6